MVSHSSKRKRVYAADFHVDRRREKRRPGCNSNPPRAKYFRRFRVERDMLKIMENTFSTSLDRNTYRAIRYMYYISLVQVAKYLWYGPDRDRVLELEHSLYNQMLSHRFVKPGCHTLPTRNQVWRFSPPTLSGRPTPSRGGETAKL